MYTNFSQAVWEPLDGIADAWGNELAPDAARLVEAYKSTVFCLVDLIAGKIGELSNNIKLCVAREITKSPSRPLVTTAEVPARFRRKSTVQREVTSHKLLDLFDNPNPWCTTHELFALTEAYNLVCGNAYWFLKPDLPGPMGLPDSIHLLPSQLVKPIKNKSGYITRYKYRTRNGVEEYDARDIIHFRAMSLNDPYGNTTNKSPVSAIWVELMTQLKEISNWDALITNAAEPRVVISPKDESAVIQKDEATRLERMYQNQYGQGGRGGPLVTTAPVNVSPLSWPAKDTSALLLYDLIHKIACRGMRVPTVYLDMTESSRASSEAAEYALQKNCLMPRMVKIVDTLNKYLCQRYDDDCYFLVENFVVRDKAYELQKRQVDLASGVTVVNEERAKEGLAPVAWGNKPMAMQAAQQPLAAPSFNIITGRSKKKSAAKKSPVQRLVEELQSIFREQAQQALSRIGKSVKATPTGRWFDIDATEMADRLQPILEVFWTDAADQLVARLGFNDAVPKVVSDKIPDAVRQAALEFCEATNATTTQAIDDAVAELRQQLTEGLTQGEAANRLTERVRTIFESAETERAYSIAVTEQSRAQHAAELMTIKESGVDVKKKWLAKSNACEQCRALSGKAVGIDEPFYVNPKGGPYAAILHPPAHPGGCTCSLEYEVEE